MKMFEIKLPEFDEYAVDAFEAESLEGAAKQFIAKNLSQHETSVCYTTDVGGDAVEIRVSLPYGAFVDYVISEAEEGVE